MMPDVTISTDTTLLDLSVIERNLRDSYWAAGRARDVIERSIANSLCFGAYATGRQVAFARVITDRAMFAYLPDVSVAPANHAPAAVKTLYPTLHERNALTQSTYKM